MIDPELYAPIKGYAAIIVAVGVWLIVSKAFGYAAGLSWESAFALLLVPFAVLALCGLRRWR